MDRSEAEKRALAIIAEWNEHAWASDYQLDQAIARALIQTHNAAVDACLKQLGGRYGAAAMKDLRMLRIAEGEK